MGWFSGAFAFLIHTALGSFLFLAAGSLAVLLCREPVRRVKLIELTLLGALLVPAVVLLPGLPRWSAGWLDLTLSASPTALVAEAPDLLTESTTPSLASRPVAAAPQETPTQASAGTTQAPSASAGTTQAPSASAGTEIPNDLGPRAGAWGLYVVVGYAAAGGLFLAWALLGFAQLVRLWVQSKPPSAELLRLFREVAGPGADRVRLVVSDRTELPLTFTAWRPIVVLPASLCRRGDARGLRFCLAHEWSHIEMGDSWRWYLATLAQVLFFYQPLFWWLRDQLRLSQDFLADARAAAEAPEAEDYAEYLVGLARRRAGIPAPALSIAGRRSSLSRRIIMLLLPRQPLERRCLKLWSAAALGVAVALLVACTALRLDAGAPADDKKDEPAKEKADKDKPAEPAKEYRYTGKVTEKGSGKAIAGAVVTVRRTLSGDPEIKETSKQLIEETKHTTDAEGKYSFTIPPEQSAKRYLYIELDVEHDDYAPQKRFGYAFSMILKNEKLGGRPFFESVELRPGKAITATVKTPEGKPAAGVKVLAFSKAGGADTFEYGSFADTKTDADGKFRLVVATPGAAVFWLLPRDYALSFHSVKEGKRGDLGALSLSNGVRFRGKVLDAKGKPLAGVNVNAETMEPNEELGPLIVADAIRRSAVTDDKGEFEMAPLPPGAYRVKPDKHASDSSKENNRQRYPMPDVFVNTKVVLGGAAKMVPVEIRAVPSVVIEMQYYDSKGKPTRGHECHVFGQFDNDGWIGDGPADADGKMVARIPHGLEQVQVNLMTNEHGVLRHRLTKNDPLKSGRRLDLGTVTEDVKGIEIIRYVAPILAVNVKDKDGRQIKDFKVKAEYGPSGNKREPGSTFRGGVEGDVFFEKQEDGRWRSSQMLPEEEMTLTASADGYESKEMKVKLTEGETKDIDFVLEKKCPFLSPSPLYSGERGKG